MRSQFFLDVPGVLQCWVDSTADKEESGRNRLNYSISATLYSVAVSRRPPFPTVPFMSYILLDYTWMPKDTNLKKKSFL